jgi:hypothetical protein
LPTISENAARDILTPYHDRIRAIVERAWAECRDVTEFRTTAGHGPRLYRRTLSNEMFDAIARHTISEFGSESSVYVRLEPQTLKIFFGSMLVARFKRGAQNKLGRNVLTQAIMDFIHPEGKLDGFPPEGGKVEFVWMSNDIQTALADVFVTARNGNRLIWSYAIPAAAAGAEIIVFNPSLAPASDDTGDLVAPKVPATDDKKKIDRE